MTEQEEEYIHFVICIANLNEAWRMLREIKQSTDSPLLGWTFQYALITYIKPYSRSDGIIKGHKLDKRFIPEKYLELHNEILQTRDQILAHTDLTILDARVYVANIQSHKYVSVGKNIIYGTEKLAKIDEIIDLIEKSLDNMYDEIKLLEAELPINS